MLRYQFGVGLNCAVVDFGAPGRPAGGEEGVVIHTGLPQVLTSPGTRKDESNFTVLCLPLQNTESRIVAISFNTTFKVALTFFQNLVNL